jgi:hypothetical protein
MRKSRFHRAMTPADTQTVLYAAAAATLLCVVVDIVVHAIHHWQRSRAGYKATVPFGWFIRSLLILVINALLCTGFAYLYDRIWAGSGNAFLVGGFLWLMISVPLLAIGRYQDDLQRGILAVRILGWLFKTGAASASAAYFLG